MSDSLLVDTLEVISAFDGVTGYLLGGEDLGSPVPDTVTVAGLLIDGDTVSGLRSGNRVVALPILVAGTSKLDLATRVNALLEVVNRRKFTVTWTPDGGLPLVLSCLRGSYVRPRQPEQENAFLTVVTLTFPALPFGASDTQQTVAVLPSGGAAQLQVDGMNSGSFTNGTRDTSTKYEGASAVSFLMGRQGSTLYNYISALVGRTITAVDLSSYVSASVRFRWPAPVDMSSGTFSGVSVLLTLSSSGGSKRFLAPTILIAKGGTAWHLATFDLSAAHDSTGTFDPTAVTQWQINVVSGTTGGNPPTTSTAWIDDLRAYPMGSVGNSTSEGMVLTLPSVVGSARAPIAVEVARWPTVQTTGNLLTAEDASLEGGTVGTWTATGATAANTTAQAGNGTHSLSLTASAAATFTAQTAGATTMLAVAPNTLYTARASLRAAVTGRSFTVAVSWYTRLGALLYTDTSTAANDVTTGFTTANTTVTSPSEAAFAQIVVTVTSPASSEVHYLDNIGLNVGSSSTFTAGTGTYRSTAALALTNTLIHFPPGDQDPDVTILAGLGAGTVTIPAANMNYGTDMTGSTYSVVVMLSASGVSTRTITVTFTQKIGATTLTTKTVTGSVTGTQTMVSVGEITLPLVAQPDENTSGSLVIAVTSTDGSDIFSDVALCDTYGQTVLTTGQPSTVTAVYVDEPDPTVEAGQVYVSTTDRTAAYYAMASGTLITGGGPPTVEPGNNRVLVASTSGAPGIVAAYYPRWLDERDQ